MRFFNDLIIRVTSTLVGIDDSGNKYYVSRFQDCYNKYRRSVVYKGLAEPSKIPALWHAWLHYVIDTIPINSLKYDWQKNKIPNMTGTKFAYFPSGSVLSGKIEREKVSGDYKAWNGNVKKSKKVS